MNGKYKLFKLDILIYTTSLSINTTKMEAWGIKILLLLRNNIRSWRAKKKGELLFSFHFHTFSSKV